MSWTRQLRRWGPVGGAAVVVIAIVAVLVVTSGDDDEDDTSAPTVPTTAATESGTVTTTTTMAPLAAGEGALSWDDAVEQGVVDDIEWGDRCDTERGTLAYPDFFAQPCYAPFEGDNGGETSPGVTGDTIKIVQFLNRDDDVVLNYLTDAIANDDTNADDEATLRGFIEFYEHFYETYGRKVELIRVTASGGSEDVVSARADAKRIADEIRPFMVWGAPTLAGLAFAEELAANEVMCFCGGGTMESYQEHDPWWIGIGKNSQQSRLLLAEYVGKRLAGRNAVHSGGFTDTERRFGYLYIETSDQSREVAEQFADLLAEYDVDLVEMVPYTLDPLTMQEQAANKIARLKDAGVTSVIFAGDAIAPRDFTREATAQEYFPEWVLAGSALVDTTVFARTYDQDQWAHAFGMSNLAARTTRETAGYYFLYEWFHGRIPEADDNVGIIGPGPAVFYAVIQGIGPNLTPENFRDALFNAEPTARDGLTVPTLSWGNKGVWPEELGPDYLGVDDVSEIWWDGDATGPDELSREGTGMYRWVDGGRRYMPGQWPETDSTVFVEERSIALYTERPADETPPDYPSPAGS